MLTNKARCTRALFGNVALASGAAALALGNTAVQAQVAVQRTVVTAPVTAIAGFGAHAGVYMNDTGSEKRSQTVIVTVPVTVYAPPGTDARMRFGARRSFPPPFTPDNPTHSRRTP